MGKQTLELHAALEKALELTNPLRCTRQKAGKSCTRQHEDTFDKEGRPLYWYGDGCRLVESFCPSCRAYWHVAVARNAVFDFDRFSSEG
jgi:hypothetical protein